MEKKIFNTDLNSLMDVDPIDVEGAEVYNPDTLIPGLTDSEKEEVEKEKKKQEKDKADEEAALIDLEDESDKNSDEDEETNDEDENKEDTPSSVKSKDKPSSSPLTPYAKLLKDEGILPNLDIATFDGSADGLKEAMVNEIIGAVDYYKESLPNRIKQLINNYEEGVPLETLLSLDKDELSISAVSEDELKDNVELQKRVVTTYLKKTTKFSDSKISKQLQYMEDSGELEDEAETANSELNLLIKGEKDKAVENAKAAKIESQRRAQEELKDLEKKINTTEEIIPGVKLNTKVKNSLYKSLTTPAGQDNNGNPVNRIVAARMEDPMGFEIKLHYLFEITKGFTDFSKLSEKGKKDAMKEFEDVVSNLDKNEDKGMIHGDHPATNNDFINGLRKTFNID